MRSFVDGSGDVSEMSGESPYGVTVLSLVNIALRYRHIVGGCGLGLALLVGVWTLTRPRLWTSSSAFMAQSRRSQANLAGIAEQLGLVASLAGGEESPAFYADLLEGRTILSAVAAGRYSPGPDTSNGLAFADLFAIRNSDPVKRNDLAIRRLQEMVSTSIVQRTGVVRVSVRTPFASASQQINSRLLELLNTFNLETRQSQASAERRFIEQREGEAQAALRQAEDQLQTFLASNRDFRNSARLTFEQDRLAREVAMRQSVYTSLAEALEHARIEEVRDTPAITVLQQPEQPVRPDSRGLIAKVLLAGFAGGLLGLFLAAVDAYLATSRNTDPVTYKRFATLWFEFKREVRSPYKAWLRKSS